MDFFKKGQDLLNKNKASSSSTTPADPNKPAEQKQDYGDKAFDFVAKKSGHKVDPKTGEKITDGARGLFEKFTGKKVDPKISN